MPRDDGLGRREQGRAGRADLATFRSIIRGCPAAQPVALLLEGVLGRFRREADVRCTEHQGQLSRWPTLANRISKLWALATADCGRGLPLERKAALIPHKILSPPQEVLLAGHIKRLALHCLGIWCCDRLLCSDRFCNILFASRQKSSFGLVAGRQLRDDLDRSILYDV